MFDTIFFDLDGTLLPMDQSEFIHAYFGRLAAKFMPMGYTKDELVGGVWKGTYAMIGNDGTMTNRERFWQVFAALMGRPIGDFEAQIDVFYANEFDRAREIAHPNGLARKVVDVLREKGYKLVLATNPVFPRVAVETRLRWIDLKPEDFSWITTYENSRFCKPNPRYFEDLLQTVGKTAEQCRMVGNNTDDDMSAAQVGMDVYLVTDYLENEKNLPVEAYPHGTLADVLAWAEALPPVQA